jgi:hypothetical protein
MLESMGYRPAFGVATNSTTIEFGRQPVEVRLDPGEIVAKSISRALWSNPVSLPSLAI